MIYDGLGRDAAAENLAALALLGHWVSYGQASGPLDPLPRPEREIGHAVAARCCSTTRRSARRCRNGGQRVRGAAQRDDPRRGAPSLSARGGRRRAPRPRSAAHDGTGCAVALTSGLRVQRGRSTRLTADRPDAQRRSVHPHVDARLKIVSRARRRVRNQPLRSTDVFQQVRVEPAKRFALQRVALRTRQLRVAAPGRHRRVRAKRRPARLPRARRGRAEHCRMSGRDFAWSNPSEKTLVSIGAQSLA